MLVLRKFYDVIRQVPELKVGNSVAAEILQQLTAVRRILYTSDITAHKTPRYTGYSQTGNEKQLKYAN